MKTRISSKLAREASENRPLLAFSLGAFTGALLFAVQGCGQAPGMQVPGSAGGGAGGGTTSYPGGSPTGAGNINPIVAPYNSTAALPGVTTYHNDWGRTGVNPNETVLTRENVNASAFGKIGALPVDGVVYAEPLYLSGVQVPGAGAHDLVFVATEHDSVYAFDAKSLSSTPVWKRSFLGDSMLPCAGTCTTVGVGDVNAPNVAPEIGITSTPVIDPVAGVIYVMATTKENGLIYWKLHGLSVATGQEISNSPVTVNTSIQGSTQAYGSDSHGVIRFVPSRQLSRSGLVLANGMVYVAFSSYDDQEPSHGWVIAYSAESLLQAAAFVTTPNSGDGNIWMAGGAPAVDDYGNLVFATANGDSANESDLDYGNSVLKIGFGGYAGFGVLDYFKPYNTAQLDLNDVDLGSGGVTLIPGSQAGGRPLVAAGGKEGTIYLLDETRLGGFNSAPGATSDPQIVQELVHALPGGVPDGPGIYGTPSFFDGKLFIIGAHDYLRSYPLAGGQLQAQDMTISGQQVLRRGATTSVSANGTSEGIVWYIDASDYTYGWQDGSSIVTILQNGPAVLMAYSTDDVTHPIYRSDAQGTSDAAGNAVKFSVPMIYGGKVFVGTQTEVSVYGLKP